MKKLKELELQMARLLDLLRIVTGGALVTLKRKRRSTVPLAQL